MGSIVLLPASEQFRAFLLITEMSCIIQQIKSHSHCAKLNFSTFIYMTVKNNVLSDYSVTYGNAIYTRAAH